VKIKKVSVEIPLPRRIVDPIFGDREPVRLEESESAPELKEANEQLKALGKSVRKQEGIDP